MICIIEVITMLGSVDIVFLHQDYIDDAIGDPEPFHRAKSSFGRKARIGPHKGAHYNVANVRCYLFCS